MLFGPNNETGELTGGDKYFLWVENEVNRKGNTRSMVYSGSLVGNDDSNAANAPQAKAKLDEDGNECTAPPKTHTRDQLVKAFHARRKVRRNQSLCRFNSKVARYRQYLVTGIQIYPVLRFWIKQ